LPGASDGSRRIFFADRVATCEFVFTSGAKREIKITMMVREWDEIEVRTGEDINEISK
jgi:hypothetical protein